MISVEGLSFRYPTSSETVLTNVSFDVRRGEIFGLLGPSGAGKSTLQRLLSRQIRQFDQGTISVLGRDVKTWDQSLYEQVGIGFELPNHYLRLTGRENLEFFASLYQSPTKPPEEALAMVNLADAADIRVSAYSKGMQVRLNFARAILHDPPLLFLDEPTTGLDPTTSAHMKDLIATLRARGKTILLTTHNMHDADQLCDRVGFVANGVLKAIDVPCLLKEKYGERVVEVTANDGTVARFALDGLSDNQNFRAFLADHDIRSIHSQEASLDQVFKIVTGVTLGNDIK